MIDFVRHGADNFQYLSDDDDEISPLQSFAFFSFMNHEMLVLSFA